MTWAAWASRVTEGNGDEGVIRLVRVRVEGTAVLVAEGEVAVWSGAHPHSIPVPGGRAILAGGAWLPPLHACWTHTNHYTHFTDGKPNLAVKVTGSEEAEEDVEPPAGDRPKFLLSWGPARPYQLPVDS